MYQRYCEEYRLAKYRESKGPEIDRLSDDNEAYTYDELVKIYGLKQAEAITFKQHQECKLFRCVVCWLIIHPDDEITEQGDGFAHKICVGGRNAFPKHLTVNERLEDERTECLNCHHAKRAHVNGQCAGVKTKGTASGNQKQVYWFCKCKEYTKGSRII